MLLRASGYSCTGCLWNRYSSLWGLGSGGQRTVNSREQDPGMVVGNHVGISVLWFVDLQVRVLPRELLPRVDGLWSGRKICRYCWISSWVRTFNSSSFKIQVRIQLWGISSVVVYWCLSKLETQGHTEPGMSKTWPQEGHLLTLKYVPRNIHFLWQIKPCWRLFIIKVPEY